MLNSTLEGDEPRHNADEERPIVCKKVHRFYFVKFGPYEDPQLKAKIEQAERLIREIDQEKFRISKKIRERQNHKAYSVWKFENLNKQYRIFEGRRKREEMNYLQLALDKLSFANSAYQGKPTNLCLSDGEFDKHRLQFRMLHKTNNVAEERQIFREIKSNRLKKAEIPHSSQLEQLQKRCCDLIRLFFYDEAAAKLRDREVEEPELAMTMEREREIADAAVKGKIWNSLGSKEDLQNQMRILSSELDELRAKELDVKANIKRAKKELKPEAIQKDVHRLEQKLKYFDKREDLLLEYIVKLKTQISDDQAFYGRYISLLKSAQRLAKMKDIEALAELSRKEVDEFMSQWNTSKAFREGYEKRVSGSLERRGICRDGRRKNQGEEEVNAKVKPERPLSRKMKWQSLSTRDSKLNV